MIPNSFLFVGLLIYAYIYNCKNIENAMKKLNEKSENFISWELISQDQEKNASN